MDLRNRPAISYLRFSSLQQGRESASSIQRQQDVLDKIVATHGLILDQALSDKGKSASKGVHRKKGSLGVLIDMLQRGEIRDGTVLCIEAMDRLVREPMTISLPLIASIIEQGMLVATGDGTVWDRININSPMNHKLVAEINSAYEYTKRLSQLALGAHAERRRKIGQGGYIPNVNGLVPAWIDRTKGQADYKLNQHAKTIELIFQLCAAGKSVIQIAKHLSKNHTPVMQGMRAWTPARIGSILRDRHAIGYYQPKRKVIEKGKIKPMALAAEILTYPAAVSAELWLEVQAALSSRTGFKSKGDSQTANLFTGKIFCPSCGSPMRVDTGGLVKNGLRKRHLLCRSYQEHSGCNDKSRYDMRLYEEWLLLALFTFDDYVPKVKVSNAGSEIAETRLLIENKMASLNALVPLIGQSPTLAETVAKLSSEIDQLKSLLIDLEMKATAKDTATPRDELVKFLTELFKAFHLNDPDTRHTLRLLISRLDFKIVAGDPFVLTGTDIDVLIDPEGLSYRLPSGEVVRSSVRQN